MFPDGFFLHRRLRSCATWLALWLCLAPAALPEGADVAYSRPGVLHLSLDLAIQMALQRNYSILVQRFNPQIVQQDVTRALGVFDPVLDLGASRLEQSRSAFTDGRFSPTRTVTRNDVVFDLGLSGVTPVGTQYRFGIDSLNNTGVLGNYAGNFTSTGGLGITQPLLRGLGTNATLFRIRIAKSNVLVSEWQLRRQLIDTLTQLIYVYNDLNLAGENLSVAERYQAQAQQLLEDNTRRADIGVMSPIDITTARADVALRQEGVILARRTQLDNENLLKQLVTSDLETMLGVRVEIEKPRSPDFKVDVLKGIQDALQLRPEYRQAILNLEQQHITVNFARNQVLPRLDLVGSLNLLGYENDFGSSLGRIGRRDSNEWQAGFAFSYPLGNHVAKGDLQSARLSAAQSLVELQRQEQDIIVQVDNASGQIVSNRARIASTTEASVLAQESLNAGEQRLRSGTGTTFVVLELQRRLAEARYAEVRARADYNKSVAEYYRRTGTTLQALNIDVN